MSQNPIVTPPTGPAGSAPINNPAVLADETALVASINTNAAPLLIGGATQPALGRSLVTAYSTHPATPAGSGANTTETTLATYSLPANALDQAERGLWVRTWGTFGSSVGNKTVKLYFGTTAFSSGSITSVTQSWYMEYEVYKTGSATQAEKWSAAYSSTNTAAGGSPPVVQSDTQSDTQAITIKVTGTSASGTNTDILMYGFEVFFMN